LRSNQESRLDNSASNRAKNSVRNDIKSADSEIQRLNSEIDVLNTKNTVLADSINSYNVKAIELKSGSSVAAEVGPLKYIAQLTGISMASVVNYMILLLIFVFDPLAVALILITNRIFQIENNEDEKNIGLENVKVQDNPNFNEKKYKSPSVFTIERDNDVLEEPIEYSDDERIEEPVFENVLDPIDEIMVDGETGEIQLPEEPLEMKQEIWLPTPQEEERDELHDFDMVMNNILGDDDEVVEIEETTLIEEPIEKNHLPKNKIALEDIKEIKERNRGFSVNVPEPRRNNMIQRIGRK
jgi:molybdopterin-binding protein